MGNSRKVDGITQNAQIRHSKFLQLFPRKKRFGRPHWNTWIIHRRRRTKLYICRAERFLWHGHLCITEQCYCTSSETPQSFQWSSPVLRNWHFLEISSPRPPWRFESISDVFVTMPQWYCGCGISGRNLSPAPWGWSVNCIIPSGHRFSTGCTVAWKLPSCCFLLVRNFFLVDNQRRTCSRN